MILYSSYGRNGVFCLLFFAVFFRDELLSFYAGMVVETVIKYGSKSTLLSKRA